jgi:hypothetical protein
VGKSQDTSNKKTDIIQAYESSFSFIDGFIPFDTLISQSKYCIPNALLEKLEDHPSYYCVLDHPLCNIPLDIDWLFKPVSNLVSKNQATQSRHPTRSSIDDAQTGRIIYRHVSYLPASNFVSLLMDDVELIDLVWDDETKRIWHCADIYKSSMLQKSLIVAWNVSTGEKDKSKIPALFVKNQSKNIENVSPHKLQFLGFVSLFTAQSSDRVIAFKLHSFVVYDYDEKQKLTNIQALISETNLYGSLVPEQLMQILQLVQG